MNLESNFTQTGGIYMRWKNILILLLGLLAFPALGERNLERLIDDAAETYLSTGSPSQASHQLLDGLQDIGRTDNPGIYFLDKPASQMKLPLLQDAADDMASQSWHFGDSGRVKVVCPYDGSPEGLDGSLRGRYLGRSNLLTQMEETIHAFETQVGEAAALDYTPKYKAYLEWSGEAFDSEAYVAAVLDENGMGFSNSEMGRYPSRVAYDNWLREKGIKNPRAFPRRIPAGAGGAGGGTAGGAGSIGGGIPPAGAGEGLCPCTTPKGRGPLRGYGPGLGALAGILGGAALSAADQSLVGDKYYKGNTTVRLRAGLSGILGNPAPYATQALVDSVCESMNPPGVVIPYSAPKVTNADLQGIADFNARERERTKNWGKRHRGD